MCMFFVAWTCQRDWGECSIAFSHPQGPCCCCPSPHPEMSSHCVPMLLLWTWQLGWVPHPLNFVNVGIELHVVPELEKHTLASRQGTGTFPGKETPIRRTWQQSNCMSIQHACSWKQPLPADPAKCWSSYVVQVVQTGTQSEKDSISEMNSTLPGTCWNWKVQGLTLMRWSRARA
jgi:hypothetical protein